jgi:hypothetical protein
VKIVLLECARGVETGTGDLRLMRWTGDAQRPFPDRHPEQSLAKSHAGLVGPHLNVEPVPRSDTTRPPVATLKGWPRH